MALSFTDSQGLFTRLGKIARLLAHVRQWQAATVPLLVGPVEDVVAQYDNRRDLVASVLPQYEAMRTSEHGFLFALRKVAEDTVLRMVADDNPLFSNADLTAALEEIIRQMTGAQTVKSCTVTATAGSVVGTGNGALVLSTKRGDGLVQENLFAETASVECLLDGQMDAGVTYYHEQLVYKGDYATLSPLHHDWPTGSGAYLKFRAIGFPGNNAYGNKLMNGGLQTWTGSPAQLANWTLTTGTWGTDAVQNTSSVYYDTYDLKLVGNLVSVPGAPTVTNQGTPGATSYSYVIVAKNANGTTTPSGTTTTTTGNATLTGVNFNRISWTAVTGATSYDVYRTASGGTPSSTGRISISLAATTLDDTGLAGDSASVPGSNTTALLTAFTQDFENYTGTQAYLLPETQIAVNFFAKRDNAAASGVLTVELLNESNAVVNDHQGVANSFTVDLTALTTSFVAKNGVFRLPRVMPSSYKIRFRLSTALSAGTNVFLGGLALGDMTEAYPGGPFLAAFTGSVPWVRKDTFTVTCTNDRGGQAKSGTITGATAANPCVVTSTAHGLANGDRIYIYSGVGSLFTDGANGIGGRTYNVANVAANTFELSGGNTTGLTYTSGGKWYKYPFLGSWNPIFDMLFSMRTKGLLLPSTSSPSIADTLAA